MGIQRVIISVIIVSSLISIASAINGTSPSYVSPYVVSISFAINGTSTFYTPPYVPSSCYGFEDQGTMIAAANAGLFKNRTACGQFYRVTCTGPTNTVSPACRNGSVRVKIVDLCPRCGSNQLDLSQEAFSIIANPYAGRVRIDYVSIGKPPPPPPPDVQNETHQVVGPEPPPSPPPDVQNEPPPGVLPPQSVPIAPQGGNRSSPGLSTAPSAPRSSYPGGISPRLWIIIGVIIGIVIVILTLVVLYIKRRRSMEGHNLVSNKGIEKVLQQHGYLSLKRFKHSEIKKITKSFTDKVGQGGYGTVYRGMLHDGCPVAVKILTETNSDGEEFVNEVVSISRTSHVNIVNLLGFCYDGNKRALVYEFMPNKSLDKFISSSGAECNLDLNTLNKIAVGVAKGLEYLHTGCSTRIVHFDIKPQNILLDEDLCPKISDFGLAKLCRQTQSAVSLLGTRGTVGYIAPEIFSRSYGRVSLKSDVYSYGMMVLEMIGANKIVQSGGSQSSENYFPDRIYELATADFTQNPDDLTVGEEEETARKLILVGFWCIQTTPSERPLMSKVVEMLEGSLESIQIPPKPVLFTPTLPQQDLSSSLSAYTETESSVEIITNG